MTRPFRVTLIAAGGIVLLLLLIVGGGIAVVQSQWFYNKVRDRIVTVAQTATGGRVEIGRFQFDWHTMTATLTNFTIRGSEPASGPPLLHADDIVVGLKIISILKRDIDIALLRIDKPQALLLIAADGSTNIPNPKTPSKSNKTASETILDLAVGRVELNDGSAEIRRAGQLPKTQTYSAKGSNLHTLFTFDAAVPRYHGDISVAPVNLTYADYKFLPADVSTTLAIEKNRLVIEKSSVASGDSVIAVNGKIENFTNPVATAEYKAKVSVKQAGDLLRLKSRQSGWLEATGSASYKSAADYAISGVVKAYKVDYKAAGMDLRNLRAQAKIDGGPKSISVDDIKAYALGGEITAKAEIGNLETFKVNGELHHFDLRQLASFATRQKLPYDASLSGTLFTQGKIADLKNNRFVATARVGLSPSGAGIPVHGLLDAKYNGLKSTIDLGQSYVALPNTRLAISGILGQQLSIHFSSANLNDLLPAIQAAAQPGRAVPAIPLTMAPQGQVTFDGTVTGPLANATLAGHLNGSHFAVQAQTIDTLSADVTGSKSHATVTNGSLAQGALVGSFSGSVGLRDWSLDNDQPLTASLGLQNARLENLMALAGQTSLPASGTLTVNATISGTVANPQAIADLTLAHGSIYGEPFDRITARIDAPNKSTQTIATQLTAGPKQVNLKASYVHSATDFIPGGITFHIDSNNVALSKIVMLNQRDPDLTGTVKLNADGMLSVARDKSNNPAVTVTKVNGSVTASGLQLGSRHLGDLGVTADTVVSGSAAPAVQVKLRSNLADANITADGHWTLAGDYPGSAKLQFTHLHLDVLRKLLLTPEQAESIPITGSIEGTLDVSGPATKPDQLQASLDIPRIEVRPVQTTTGAAGPIDTTVRNSGPIRVTLANNVIHVESAKIAAQDSTFEITGSAKLAPHPDINLQLNGDVNLAILQLFDNTVVSSGSVTAHATVKGDFTNPVLGGSLQLKNANLAIAGLPNGLSNANGTIAFTGTQAFVRELTAESGGGKVRFGGFASFAGGDFSFRLRAAATGVRVRYPQGISTVADAQLTLVGNATRSVLSGSLTIDRLAFNPRTDLGSLLSSASAPPETPSANSGVANNVQLDVQIQTAPDIVFESSYTESIEADASLRLRGSMTNPALLGRINITQGDIAFFGNKYTINQGSVSFFNPVRIEPILNIDLETVARGVDVSITVSGPVTKLNVSYRSDPPLQFSDIVGLLATGRTPNDASIAARQPTAPQQSWQQMGASALVGQAIANPVAGRLQRFFGVSNLKIDPAISSITGSPQAKVTLEQQITPDIIFTYITDVANAQEQVIRVEWDFSPHWSAVALRDENGEFGIDFLYKKRFK